MKIYTCDIILAAHKRSIRHKDEILESNFCACFFCLKTFQPDEIVEWADSNQTAICPKCEIDSVIGDKSGYPVTDIHFLKQMNDYWF